jgi:hypothetical protein
MFEAAARSPLECATGRVIPWLLEIGLGVWTASPSVIDSPRANRR